MGTIKSYQQQVQNTVDKAITAVEGQHKAITDASFGYAEKLYSVNTVKAKHDDAVVVAYDKARDVNKLVGNYAGDIISKYEKTASPAKKAAKKATKKATKAATTAKKSVAKKAGVAA